MIICDEPTSALDPLVAEEVLKLLKGLQDRLGLAYVFITHDLGTVRRIAHRTAVMLKGEIIAQGVTLPKQLGALRYAVAAVLA